MSGDFKALEAVRATWRNNRRVLNNFFFLSVVQLANYMAPLITLPYLTRVLGLSRFGLVELARAVSVYFLILTDYGFSLSATREVSIHRDDPRRVSEIFSAVLLLKFLLVILSLLALCAIVFAVPKLRSDWPVYFLAFASVIGMWLFPIWLFQGLEQMKYIPMLNVTAKALVVVCIFVFVRGPDDYMYVPLLQSSGTILIGVAGLAMAMRKFPVRFRVPSLDVLKREFAGGWYLFVSRMSVTLYTTGNIVVLGLLTDNVFVAYYAAGDKIVRAAVDGLQVPLSQAIYPHIGRLAVQSRQAALRFAARAAGLLTVVTLMISAGLLLGAPYIARAVFGEGSQGGVSVIRILSFLPVIAGLNGILGVQVMTNFGLKRLLAAIVTAAGVLNIVAAVLLVPLLKHQGAALAALGTEIVIAVALFISLRRHNLNVFAALGKDVDSLQ